MRRVTIESEPSCLPQWRPQMGLALVPTASDYITRRQSLQKEPECAGVSSKDLQQLPFQLMETSLGLAQPSRVGSSRSFSEAEEDDVEIFFFQDKAPGSQTSRALPFLYREQEGDLYADLMVGSPSERLTCTESSLLKRHGQGVGLPQHPDNRDVVASRPSSSPSTLPSAEARAPEMQLHPEGGATNCILHSAKAAPKSILVKQNGLRHARSLGRRVRFNKYVSAVVCS